MARISLLLVDEEPLHSLGVRTALEMATLQRHLTIETVHEARDPSSALSLLEAERVHAIISEIVFKGAANVDVIHDYQRACPGAALIVLTHGSVADHAERALGGGANAFISKTAPIVDVWSSLLDALVPDTSKSSRGHRRARGDRSGEADFAKGFTPREVEVGSCLARGLALDVIAANLNISVKTVATHRENLRRKLNCKTSIELSAMLGRMFFFRDNGNAPCATQQGALAENILSAKKK